MKHSTLSLVLLVAIKLGTKGNEMAFNKTMIQVKPGEQVQLTFTNNSEPGTGMQHSWVLVKPGTEEKVAGEAVAAGPSKNYIPDDPNVLAHTRLLDPGKSATVSFKAPSQPGEYPYICTYPGHSQTLHGILKVG